MALTGSPVGRPADRIVLTNLVLRRWSRSDALILLAAVLESFEHLHPWMPWAAHPPVLSDEDGFLDSAVRQWATGEAFLYGIFDRSEQTLLGSIGLYDRVGSGGWEIGYWVHTDRIRHGIATTSAAVLTDVALSLPGTQRVEIHCDQANTASVAVPLRLGYRLDRIQDETSEAPAELGKRMIWVMTRDAYPGSEADRRAHPLA
jgi:RimJ/RimL family protein N-acetyltransferase